MAERYPGSQERCGVTSPKGPSDPSPTGQSCCGTCLPSLCTPGSTLHVLSSTGFLEDRAEAKTHGVGEQGTPTPPCP